MTGDRHEGLQEDGRTFLRRLGRGLTRWDERRLKLHKANNKLKKEVDRRLIDGRKKADRKLEDS